MNEAWRKRTKNIDVFPIEAEARFRNMLTSLGVPEKKPNDFGGDTHVHNTIVSQAVREALSTAQHERDEAEKKLDRIRGAVASCACTVPCSHPKCHEIKDSALPRFDSARNEK